MVVPLYSGFQSDFPVLILGMLLDQFHLGRRQVKQGIDPFIKSDFQADNFGGQAVVFGALVGQLCFQVRSLFEWG